MVLQVVISSIVADRADGFYFYLDASGRLDLPERGNYGAFLAEDLGFFNPTAVRAKANRTAPDRPTGGPAMAPGPPVSLKTSVTLGFASDEDRAATTLGSILFRANSSKRPVTTDAVKASGILLKA